jgi:hypothetical protein
MLDLVDMKFSVCGADSRQAVLSEKLGPCNCCLLIFMYLN